MGNDRRKHPRQGERREFPRIEISLSASDNDENVIGIIKDISLGGCFIETKNTLPVDSTISINFLLPEKLSEITTRGAVASIRTEPIGMGIKFFAMPPEFRSILSNFIRQEIGTVQINKLDRRKKRRIDLNLSVLSLSGEEIGTTCNVSLTGCFIKSYTGEAVRQGDELDIRLVLPQNAKEITTKIKIVHDVLPDGLGVAFISMDMEDKIYLGNLLNELSADFII